MASRILSKGEKEESDFTLKKGRKGKGEEGKRKKTP